MNINRGVTLFQAKKDIYHVKSQRLILAQDEYNHLNNALAALTTSRTSCKWLNINSKRKNYNCLIYFSVFL